MSIYGKRITALGMAGVPAKPEGSGGKAFGITIGLALRLAGSYPRDFDYGPLCVSPEVVAQQGDGGVTVVITVVDPATSLPVDMSAATNLSLLMRKPDLTTVAFSAALAGNGLDGRVSYALDASDMAEAGFYDFQLSFQTSSTPWFTSIGTVRVISNLTVTP